MLFGRHTSNAFHAFHTRAIAKQEIPSQWLHVTRCFSTGVSPLMLFFGRADGEGYCRKVRSWEAGSQLLRGSYPSVRKLCAAGELREMTLDDLDPERRPRRPSL